MKANNTSKVSDGKIEFIDPDSNKPVKAPQPPKVVPNSQAVAASDAFAKLRTNERFRVR